MLIALLLAAASDASKAEHFEKKVRPVLVAHCQKCHGPTGKARGKLRLTSRADLLRGGDLGPAVMPGEPGKSRLIEAVEYGNPELQMPPEGKLPPEVIADLKRWVLDGAHWPGEGGTATIEKFDLAARKKSHWAWKPHSSPALPVVKDRRWGRDPIDAFILARLEAEGLSPSPDASPRQLARRLAFDLTGLPPAPDALTSTSDAAVAAYVDKLLASKQFGEKWGRSWLDLVRYAESRGHEFDYTIPNAYQYRDYVIRAFNADVPYNRLVLEHVAGDLLHDPRIDPATDTNESLIATGFWHLGEEVHSPVDIRGDQADRFDNRLDVLSKAFLGLTVACARCHDHKFDAISTKDYYALFGVLSSSGYRLARIDGYTKNRAVARKLAALREEQSRALPRPDYTPPRDEAHGQVVVDYADLKPGQWLPDDVAFGPGPARAGEYRPGRVVERTAAEYDPFWSILKYAPGTEQDPGSLGSGRAGRTIRTPAFTIAEGRIYALVRGSARIFASVGGHIVIAGPLHGRVVQNVPHSGAFRWVSLDLSPYRGLTGHLELTATSDDFAVARVIQARTAPPAPPAPKLPELPPGMFDKWRAAEKKLSAEVVAISRLALAMYEGTGVDEPVFLRGSAKNPGPVVPRRYLEALAGEKPFASSGSGRLELAQLMTDPKVTPLTPRVLVNRLWHHLFGRGLVASVDDFGVMGAEPTHPELLDHLAQRLIQERWSIKKLIRAIVLSRTYRQACAETPASKRDPENRLWHRAMLRRLPAEAIRDAILACSGRLDPAQFGPSVPVHLTSFQEGRGRPASGPIDGDGRRSIYLSVRRNFLSSFLLAFDAPIPFSCVGRRTVSNVPAQSLILMNDPFVHQMSRRWAKTVLSRPGSTEERIQRMYQAAFGRLPTSAEKAACKEHLASASKDEFDSWASLAHALMNVKEFIFVQ
jgi:cytochrome c553